MNMNTIEAILGIVIAIALVGWGYRLKRIAFAILWFIAGYLISKSLLPHVTTSETLLAVLPIGGGLILSLIGLSIERFCVFISAAVTAFMIAIENLGGYTSWANVFIAIAIAVVVGCIAVWLMKPAIIAITSLAGAHVISLALLSLFSIAHNPWYLIFLVVIAGFGAAHQFATTKNLA